MQCGGFLLRQLDFDEIVKLAEKYCGNWARVDAPRDQPLPMYRPQRKDLIDPKFKGKAAILDVPAIGIMDAALCFESAGLIKYGNKGNMTKQEIDFTCDKLIELKKAGQFRATWTTFDQSVQ